MIWRLKGLGVADSESGPVETETPDLGYTISEITQLMKLLHEAYNSMKFSPIESLPLEIAVVEFYNLRKKKN